MAESALSVRGLTKSFKVPRLAKARGGQSDPRRHRGRLHDRFDAISEIGFEVPRGQTLGIIGANGSGKTTLLKLLSGVMEASAGSIQAHGRVGALLELGAGFHPELSGVENVHLSGAVLGLGRREIQRYLAEIIEFAELERFMEMPVKHYSSGMVVRLGFAVATQIVPDILLLDETFAVGDARFQARAMGRIRRFREQGVTLLLVSHNAELIIELADRALWLDHGRLAMDGEPAAVLASYRRRCGSFLSGGERLSTRLLGEEALRPLRPGQANVKILEATLRGGTGGEEGARAAEGAPLRLQSHDRLEIDAALRFEPGAQPSDYRLQVLFHRDDNRVVAEANMDLPDEPQESEPNGADRARTRRLRLEFDPVRLAKGVYEVTLALERRDEETSEWVEARQRAARSLEITTALPYDFRLVAEVEGRWGEASRKS